MKTKSAPISIPRRRARRQPLVILLSFAAVLLILLSVVIVVGARVAFSDTSFPNIYADTVSLGSMTKEEILSTLQANGWENRTVAKLKVKTYNDMVLTFDPVKAGVILSAEEATEKAVSYGHSSNIFASLLHYLKCLKAPVDINEQNTALNTEYIRSRVNSLKKALDSLFGESTYYVDEEKAALVCMKTAGPLSFNMEELCSFAAEALIAGKTEMNYTVVAEEPVCPDFKAIADEICSDVANAGFSDVGHQILQEKEGISFDLLQALSLWEAADVGDAVHIPLTFTEPETTAASLEASLFQDLLGAVTTKYNNSNDNRCSNVRLATSKVDGTVLYPGEEFSFNSTVGMRTAEAGYLMAPAYAGYGDIKDEIGGGVCQVSTGIYAASLFSFLDITSHTCHVYPPNYIQLGMDATVSIPENGGRTIDLRVKNNRNYPVKIVGYCEETTDEYGHPRKYCTIEIWGTLEEDDYMPVEFDNSYSVIYDYDRFIDPAQEGREGYKIKFTHEEFEFEDDYGKGIRTLTHRKVYDSSGNLVEDMIINPTYSAGYALDTYYYRG